jgi:hypothetical protein
MGQKSDDTGSRHLLVAAISSNIHSKVATCLWLLFLPAPIFPSGSSLHFVFVGFCLGDLARTNSKWLFYEAIVFGYGVTGSLLIK